MKALQLLSRTGRALVAVIASLAATGVHGDEGAWLLDDLPREALQARHAFVPEADWLANLRLAALNVGGASGSFVSPTGLVLTNHHVALGCLQKISTPERDLVESGFVAQDRAGERSCPGMELKRLESSEDVTAAIQAALQHAADPAAANAERNAAMGRLEATCAAATGLSCEVETLYRGARYRLLRYRTFRDVRLVFAPESSVGFFGGDPDNFVYPRFALDVAFLRVYENGAPLRPAHFLHWSARGVAEGDLVFAAGHPYSTDRLVTVAQIEADRDLRYPAMTASARRHRALLERFGARSPEAARRAAGHLFGTENWLKSLQGEAKALNDPALLARKRSEEERLSLAWRVAGREDPFTRIAAATARQSVAFKETWVVGYGYETLFDVAGRIVEIANERALPDAQRLAAYRDAAIERVLVRLGADVPIYKDLESARIAGDWEEASEVLGPAHPFVQLTIGESTPARRAAALVEASQLDRVAERKRLLEGGLAAVDASTDPLIVLARAVYPLRRRLAKAEEIDDEVIRSAADEIAALRLAVRGRAQPPDATGSLRLSYGVVRGYDADGIRTPWRTNLGGLFARHDAFGGTPPFSLPPRWLAAQRALVPATPLDFVSTLDIIGGNSGSPVVDRQGEVVGVVFDGNLESLGARFAYTDDKARAIAVDGRAIIESLAKVYGARALVAEILGN